MQTLSAPSKTFLVGEYGVLSGGPALVLNTEPRFELKFEKTKTEQEFYAHSESPAGKLWKHFLVDVISDKGPLKFNFLDPWDGSGGMGRSGAEFILLREWLKQNGFSTGQTLIEDYKKFATSGSGTDVIAQNCGLVTMVSGSEIKALKWPAWDLFFLIYKTGRKMKTHEHLEEANKKKSSPRVYKNLAEVSGAAINAYRKKSLHDFLNNLMDFSSYQKKHGLIDSENYYLLEKIMALPSVYFARGCGALGFDTLLVFYQKEFEKTVRNDIQKDFPFLKLVADTSKLTTGVK